VRLPCQSDRLHLKKAKHANSYKYFAALLLVYLEIRQVGNPAKKVKPFWMPKEKFLTMNESSLKRHQKLK